MKYKYSHTEQIVREELLNTSRIKNLIEEYILEKQRLEKILTVDFTKPPTVFIDETFIHKNYAQKNLCNLLI